MVRAVIMSSIMIISKLVYRKSDTLNNIAVSCLLILIINPYYILNLGFQLSFLGTLGIVLFNSKIISHLKQKENVKECKPYLKTLNKLLEKIKSIIIISISANTLIFPILIYSFNSISFIFLISNILVTPILGVMSLTGYFTMVLSLFSVEISKIFSIILNLYINIFKKIAEFNSSLTFARFITITPSYITIIAYYLIIFYVFYFYKKKHNKIILKLLSFSMIIVIMFNVLNKYNSSLKLHFIDVGQGDSTLIITSGNKKILIDGGGSETGNYDVGKNVLVPYLLDRKIKTIDFIIFSHFDTDHCAGLFTVMKELNVKNAIISTQGNMSENYKYFLELAKRKNINVICVQAGNRLQIDKFTYIDILWPNKNLIQENILNNNSIVCKLNYAATSILFTGDIEQIAEEEILKIYNKKILKSTILKVAHHGSKSSSIQDFIIQVQPKIALIGVGEKNNFGHPNEKVLERLQQCNSIIYRTDKNGEISIKVKKNGKIYINTEI